MVDLTPASSRPRGRAIRWDDEDLEKLTMISESDIDHANEEWQQNSPAFFRGLLEAKAEDKDG